MLKKPLALFISASLLFIANTAVAQTVTGEVTDESKRVPFKGALVSIEGVQRSTSTDDRGRFRPVGRQHGGFARVQAIASSSTRGSACSASNPIRCPMVAAI